MEMTYDDYCFKFNPEILMNTFVMYFFHIRIQLLKIFTINMVDREYFLLLIATPLL